MHACCSVKYNIRKIDPAVDILLIINTDIKDLFRMKALIVFQLIALSSLAIYMLYIIYYMAVPLMRLRFLMFLAYKKYHCTEIRISDTGVVVRVPINGHKHTLWGRIDPDQDMAYYAMAACSELKKILRDIRRGNI